MELMEVIETVIPCLKCIFCLLSSLFLVASNNSISVRVGRGWGEAAGDSFRQYEGYGLTKLHL